MMKELTERYPKLKGQEENIEKAVSAIINCYEKDGKLLLCGNGGSSSDCEHISGELLKGFLKRRPLTESQKKLMKKRCPLLTDEELSLLQQGLPAIPLASLTALMTAYGNDVSSDLCYAQGVLALGKEGDILLGVSTSGNSKNVLAAAKTAKGAGMKVIALTGSTGGKLKEISDIAICADEEETYKIQELHLPIYHYICSRVEEYFFDE